MMSEVKEKRCRKMSTSIPMFRSVFSNSLLFVQKCCVN